MRATFRPQNLDIFSLEGDDPIPLDGDQEDGGVDKASRGNLDAGTKDTPFRRRRRRRRRAASESGPVTDDPTERRVKRQKERHMKRTPQDLQQDEDFHWDDALVTPHPRRRRPSSPIQASSSEVYTGPVRSSPNTEALKEAQAGVSSLARSADDMDTLDEQRPPSAYRQDWPVNDLHDHRETEAGVEYLTE